MKIASKVFCFILIFTMFFNISFEKKTEAVAIVDDLAIAMVATALVATGVSITLANKDAVKNWCTDLINASATGIASWVIAQKAAQVAGANIISDVTSSVTGSISSYLDTKPKNSSGQLVDGCEYFTRILGGYQCLSDYLFTHYTSDNIRKIINNNSNIDLGFSNNVLGVNYSLISQPISGTNFCDLIGTYVYNGSTTYYGNINCRYDTSFKPIIFIKDRSFTNTSYTDVFYFGIYYKDINGVFQNNYVFSALNLFHGGFAIGTTPVTTASTYSTVQYQRSSFGSGTVATPSTIDGLVGATPTSVLTSDVIPTTLPTATPIPTTIPNTYTGVLSDINTGINTGTANIVTAITSIVGTLVLDFVTPFQGFKFSVDGKFMPYYNNFKNTLNTLSYDPFEFEDLKAVLFGEERVVVKLSMINQYLPTARGWFGSIFWIFYSFFVYDKIYFLVRGTHTLNTSIAFSNIRAEQANRKAGG